MRIAAVIARYLLGAIFLIFGLNGFLHFIPMSPMPAGPAQQYIGALSSTGYMTFVFVLQVIGGALLLAGQYLPLALTLLGPVVVNILLFHSLMAPAGLPIPLLVAVCWFLVFFRVFPSFAGLFERRQQEGFKA